MYSHQNEFPQEFKKIRVEILFKSIFHLETGIGGVKSPKIRGGVKMLTFQGPLKFDPFLQSFYRKSPIWGSKVQVFEGQLSGRVPPPSSVRYVLTPPVPVSDPVFTLAQAPHVLRKNVCPKNLILILHVLVLCRGYNLRRFLAGLLQMGV